MLARAVLPDWARGRPPPIGSTRPPVPGLRRTLATRSSRPRWAAASTSSSCAIKDAPDERAARGGARATRRLCAAAGALLIVNDRPDLARAADADGVHVGQDDVACCRGARGRRRRAARRALDPLAGADRRALPAWTTSASARSTRPRPSPAARRSASSSSATPPRTRAAVLRDRRDRRRQMSARSAMRAPTRVAIVRALTDAGPGVNRAARCGPRCHRRGRRWRNVAASAGAAKPPAAAAPAPAPKREERPDRRLAPSSRS